jgi:coenzyme F420-0:L-glutamate ligase/coenzyme F420-1:gamma-L-glutamate ligase
VTALLGRQFETCEALLMTTIAIIGGTGPMGRGLAYRWARAGYPILIGSRTAARAEEAATALSARVAGAAVRGAENTAAAGSADLVVLTVPYAHHAATIKQIKTACSGKIVVDATVPLRPPKVGRVQLPAAGCAALEAQAILGDTVRVVSAFQNVGAANLDSDAPIDCDVLVAGDQVAARAQVIELIRAAGLRAWHVGPLANSAAAEALTSVLIQINKKYRYAHSGIRITPGSHGSAGDSYAPDRLELVALTGLPMVEAGQDVAALVLEGLASNDELLMDGDVVVVAQKVISKAEGRVIALADVEPGEEARRRAAETDKDPRLVELILRESNEVVRQDHGVMIVEHRSGLVLANAGVDQSNVPEGHAVLLPEDADASARALLEALHSATGKRLAVIIIDSIGRAWRNGTVGHAIGVAGLAPLLDLRATRDLFDRPLRVTEVALADEIAAAASALMGQASEGKPVVLVRGFSARRADQASAQTLLREKRLDLFR